MVVVGTEQTFGQKLKALRLARELTQAELGEASGMPQTVIARLERGAVASPTLDTLTRLADALGVSLDEFRLPPTRAQGKRK